MTSTYTRSFAKTFTVTNAKYLASKVKTDLMRLHHYYYDSHGSPSVQEIEQYHEELVLLQIFDFLEEIEYGFQAGGRWIKALKYTARQGGVLTSDEDPGGIRYRRLPLGLNFSSVLQCNSRWYSEPTDRESFLLQTPFMRHIGYGYEGNWSQRRAYSSGGRGFIRSDI